MSKKKKYKGSYRIKYKYKKNKVKIVVVGTKDQAMNIIKRELLMHSSSKALLQVPKKSGTGWKSHSSYSYRKNKKTGRMRLVKL